MRVMFALPAFRRLAVAGRCAWSAGRGPKGGEVFIQTSLPNHYAVVAAMEALGVQTIEVVADRGYFKSEEILQCDEAGITAFVPKPLTSGKNADGHFGKQEFVYIAEDDEYRCPAQQRLTLRFTTVEHGMTLHCYSSSACATCAIRKQCT